MKARLAFSLLILCLVLFGCAANPSISVPDSTNSTATQRGSPLNPNPTITVPLQTTATEKPMPPMTPNMLVSPTPTPPAITAATNTTTTSAPATSKPPSPTPTGYSFREDFRYSSLAGIENAGWSRESNQTCSFSLDGEFIKVQNEGTEIGVLYYDHFKSGNPNWKVESKVQWIGGSNGSFSLDLLTDKHCYGFLLDGQNKEPSVIQDGIKILRFDGYQPGMNAWANIGYEAANDTINMYINGNLIDSCPESDAGYPTKIRLVIGYSSIVKIDWVSLVDF